MIRVRWLALGGIVGPVLFASVVVACGSLRSDYSHVAQFVSELGATGTPHAGFMNFAGFVSTGALIVAFGMSLPSALPSGRVSRIAGILLALFGLGLVLAGIFPCEPGCPQESPTFHDAFSVAAFLSAIAGIGLSAYHFRAIPAWRSLWLYSAFSSAVASCLLVALAASLDSRVFTGLWQRLLIGTLFLWCAVVGVRAFRLGERPVRGEQT